MEKQVEIKDKITLTIKEAAALSNIGENKLRAMTKMPNCPFALENGTKMLIKRRKLEEYLENCYTL